MAEVNAAGEELCDFTELPKETCSHCRSPVPRQEYEGQFPTPSGPGVWAAKYSGICWGCGEDIDPGDMIKKVTTDLDGTRYHHEEC